MLTTTPFNQNLVHLNKGIVEKVKEGVSVAHVLDGYPID
ncbi:hypothetical protein BZ20_3301 [Yersinia pseudotuberculosis]|nr:hypothetical protein BZ20_3301 [Yersinia pseudotuberculosis]